MSSHTLNLTPALLDYLQEVGLREPAILQELRQKTAPLTGAQMQISPEQGQLMAMLMPLIGARKTLDIGTFTGYSALVVALALPEQGRVISCDIDPIMTKLALETWQKAGMAHKIELKLGDALASLTELEKTQTGEFDFVFIDADKGNYRAYYEASLNLLRVGGLIAIDNVLWDGAVIDLHDVSPPTMAIKALNQFVATDPRVAISMIPIGDGLTLARKL